MYGLRTRGNEQPFPQPLEHRHETEAAREPANHARLRTAREGVCVLRSDPNQATQSGHGLGFHGTPPPNSAGVSVYPLSPQRISRIEEEDEYVSNREEEPEGDLNEFSARLR